jgi:hypothetical protein
VAVRVVHEFDNIETIKRAIEIGSGVALLPKPTVAREVSSGALATAELSDADLVRPLGIVHKRSRQLTTAVQKFIELLQRGETAVAAGTGAAVPQGDRRSNGQKTNGQKANGATVHTRTGGRSTLLAAPRRRRKSKRV